MSDGNFAFERNEHGHVVLTFEGLDLTGKEEIERLTNAGYGVSGSTRSCLLSTRRGGYDKRHRLSLGKTYKVALMPMLEIPKFAERSTGTLLKRGIKKYGYKRPRAGIMPRIREVVSNEEMKEMGFWHITAPHKMIRGAEKDPFILETHRIGSGRWLSVTWGRSGIHSFIMGAFAFVVPTH